MSRMPLRMAGHPVAARGCTRCERGGPGDTVFLGSGDDTPAVLVVGGAPTPGEAPEAGPFSGREGQVVRALLTKAGVPQGLCRFTYLLRCHSSTSPRKAHVQACKHWLWQEMKVIHPKVILALGSGPSQLLLGEKGGMVGEFHTVPWTDALIAPWLATVTIAQGGKDIHKRSFDFFRRIRDAIS